MRVRILLVVALIAIVNLGCDGGNPPGMIPTPPPAPVLHTITGTVSSVAGPALANATMRVEDGPNAGQSATTDGSGRYTITGLTFAGFSVSASAPDFEGRSRGIPLSSTSATTTADFSLLPNELWRRSGTGNAVFSFGYPMVVRIVGTFRGEISSFIVRIDGRLVVNEVLGDFLFF